MLDIRLNADRAISGLTDLELRQLPFALANALNRTGEEVETAEREHVDETFTIRRPWVTTNVRITRGDYATKTKMQTVVEVQEGSVLTKFEGGGVKTPTAGGRAVAVPIDVKRNKNDIIAKSNRPRAFAFVQGTSRLATRNTIYRGARRTFMVQMADGSGWIFKRTGRGHHGDLFAGADVLYVLKPEVPIPNLLHFYELGETVAVRRFGLNMQGMLEYALRTAK